MAFAIPDAALANVTLTRTRGRNRKRLSPASFAYHPDKNVFDAVLTLMEYRKEGSLFAVQIDFEKYFDSIPTRHLRKQIDNRHVISLTPHEKFIFKAFLRHQYVVEGNVVGAPVTRRAGTPQGSSVSLLLSNLANHDLDLLLAASPGRFVRYADDVVVLCGDYAQAQDIERCFAMHCRESGLTLNQEKSPGIAIISEIPRELRTYQYFDYLGYRFSSTGLSMPQKAVSRIKTRISRLINIYLLYYLRFGYNIGRSGLHPHQFDWDLLGLIYEIRKSLYGNLSEEEIQGFLNEGRRLRHVRGLMGFYCLLNESGQLRELDGWMLSAVRRAMVARNRLLLSQYGRGCPTPSNSALARGDWLDPASWRGGSLPESGMPSLVRGWRAARKHYFTFGLEDVEPPRYDGYGGFENVLTYG